MAGLFALALAAAAMVPPGFMPAAGAVALRPCLDISPSVIAHDDVAAADSAMASMVMPGDGTLRGDRHAPHGSRRVTCTACGIGKPGLAADPIIMREPHGNRRARIEAERLVAVGSHCPTGFRPHPRGPPGA